MADAMKREGIPYDHVDANGGVGGNWYDGVFETTHIVSSKGTTAYADYPMPAEYPDFPSAEQMLAYLEAYARDRDLMGAMEFDKAVAHCHPNRDDTWDVTFDDNETRTYKGVVVCNGHHWKRRFPDVPGTFEGEYIHAKDYRRPEQLAGKRVLVVGAGNSASDIACEAARVGAGCDLSLRSGYWFMPKTAFGMALTDLPIWWMPVALQRIVLRGLIKVIIGDYRRYGLKKPNHRIFDRHPTYGTDLLNYLRLGKIHPREEIAQLEGDTVRFRDGTVGQYDMIVAATGYDYSFPFLPTGLIDVQGDVVQVYGGAFPDKVKNLYIIGASQPRGGFGRVVTPAARLYAKMMKLQDEIDHPIGAVLAWRNNPIPTSHLMDTESTRRRIALSHYLLPLLKRSGRRMADKVEREYWEPAKPPAIEAEAERSGSGKSAA